MFKTEYRIVRDSYAGYEVQMKRWWWPIWTEVGWVNTHSSLEGAKKYLYGVSKKEVYRVSRKELINDHPS